MHSACTPTRFRPARTNAQPRAAVPTWLGMMQAFAVLATFTFFLPLLSCSRHPDPETLVMIIESSPTNLDPRIGIDAWSERIDGLLFANLVTRDEHLSVTPSLAQRWELPYPTTYIFHLRPGVTSCDGRSLPSRHTTSSFDSLPQPQIPTTTP